MVGHMGFSDRSWSWSDEDVYAEINLPGLNWYALVIRYLAYEKVLYLYMEEMGPGKGYVYRVESVPDPASHTSDAIGILGNVLSPELVRAVSNNGTLEAAPITHTHL
jgi:hypothetical protein